MILKGKKVSLVFFILLILFPFQSAFSDVQSIPVLFSEPSHGGVSYSLSIKIIAMMTLLSVLPALLITMSAFTRIVVVLAILRQGIGIPNVPGNQVIIGLSLIMTLFVMMPILEKMNTLGLQPYMDNKINEQQALYAAGDALKVFMMKQTRQNDLKLFSSLSRMPMQSNNNVSMLVLMPAFITSELKTAFEIGFLILLPFLIIDIVISSILMSMGMMMLSPMVISLPFKILFFVLVDGWSLIVTSLITSFRI
jgi:flagellar biosynthetic protein FliP